MKTDDMIRKLEQIRENVVNFLENSEALSDSTELFVLSLLEILDSSNHNTFGEHDLWRPT